MFTPPRGGRCGRVAHGHSSSRVPRHGDGARRDEEERSGERNSYRGAVEWLKVEVSWGRLLRGHSRGGLHLLQLEAFFSSFDRFAVAPMLLTIAVSLRGRSPIVCFFSFHEDGKLPWRRSKGRVVNTCYFNGV